VEFDDLKSFDSAYPSQHTSVTRATIVLGKAIFDCVHVFITKKEKLKFSVLMNEISLLSSLLDLQTNN
jgi:hypothetical protein